MSIKADLFRAMATYDEYRPLSGKKPDVAADRVLFELESFLDSLKKPDCCRHLPSGFVCCDCICGAQMRGARVGERETT
jgi:hypothetical protein